jgi:hypothetical protein
MGLSSSEVKLDTLIFPDPCYSRSEPLIVEIKRRVVPRPERQGFPLSRFPEIDLARIMVCNSQHIDQPWKIRHAVCRILFPEIEENYNERHPEPERTFSVNVFRMRVWNGINNGEFENYAHLMNQAFSEYTERRP